MGDTKGGGGRGCSLIRLNLSFVQQIVHITLLRGDDSLSESQQNNVVGKTEAEASTVSRWLPSWLPELGCERSKFPHQIAS